jgi:hypothetical protein
MLKRRPPTATGRPPGVVQNLKAVTAGEIRNMVDVSVCGLDQVASPIDDWHSGSY